MSVIVLSLVFRASRALDWFEGRRMLERLFGEMLESGSPDFCLGRANHFWSGIWKDEPYRLLVHQAHFEYLTKAFEGPHYITVDGKPLILLFKPTDISDFRKKFNLWRTDEHRLVFLKSWNEWTEGNHFEPDAKWELEHLQALKRVIV